MVPLVRELVLLVLGLTLPLKHEMHVTVSAQNDLERSIVIERHVMLDISCSHLLALLILARIYVLMVGTKAHQTVKFVKIFAVNVQDLEILATV